jgi:capsular exopolysaccharide synthesis family protein
VADSSSRLPVLGEGSLDSRFAEAYRELRANINFGSIDQPVKTIMVTSASRGEGKSTTVLNLAVIMAQAGLQVVAVDADLRASSLQRMVASLQGIDSDHASKSGLSIIILSSASVKTAVIPTHFERVSLLPAGPIPPNPSELLGSQRMQRVVTDLSQSADYVIIDTPPCSVYSDALMLSRMVDGVVYVVRTGTQSKARQQRVQKQLQQAKARVLGIVLNDVQVGNTKSGYGY